MGRYALLNDRRRPDYWGADIGRFPRRATLWLDHDDEVAQAVGRSRLK
jgi:hypothetical protein